MKAASDVIHFLGEMRYAYLVIARTLSRRTEKLKQELEVIVHGEPTTDNLTENDKVAFYTTLFMRLQQLAKDGK